MRFPTRRDLLRLTVALPCAGLFSPYRVLAAPNLKSRQDHQHPRDGYP
jgi:hypothetical protein